MENLYVSKNSINICRLLDITVNKVCRVGLGSLSGGDRRERCSNAYIKQMAIYDGYHKLHSLSTLIVSFPNGMSTVIQIVSTREHDFTILT